MPAPVVWTEHQNAEGRKYWYHTLDKRSVWEKPSELKTPRERAMEGTPWKQYQSGERSYYVNSTTKETTWSVPKELEDLFAAIPDEAAAPPTPSTSTNASASVAGTTSGNPSIVGPMSPPVAGLRPIYSGPPPGFGPSASPPVVSSAAAVASPIVATPQPIAQAQPQPEPIIVQPQLPRAPPTGPSSSHPFVTGPSGYGQDAESAFTSLLRAQGVDASWTWERTMRTIITDPLYKALKTMADRKAAFTRYIESLRLEEEKRKKEAVKALEGTLKEVMGAARTKGTVKAFYNFDAVEKVMEKEAVWIELKKVGEQEARDAWEAIKKTWRDEETASVRELRHRNMDMLMSLLLTFEADVFTRWKDAHRTVVESSEWETDAHLSSMDLSDMLIVFDEHMKSLEKEKGDALKEREKIRKREQRKRRETFKARLQSFVNDGTITARTAWPTVYARVKNDEGFEELIAQPGSSPLDLFFDVVEELDEKLRARTRAVEKVLESAEGAWKVEESTSFEEFKAKVEEAARKAGEGAEVEKDEKELRLVHEELVSIAARHAKDIARRVDRKLRHLSDDLRYALRKVPSLPLTDDAALQAPWDEWRGKLSALELRDWTDMDKTGAQADKIDEARKSAWERFVKRQLEKNAERKKEEEGKSKRGTSAGSTTREEGEGRKRKGEETEEGERRRTARRRTDDMAEGGRERDRRERRSGAALSREEESARKRPRRERSTARSTVADGDSEKEEGEV